MLVVLSLKAVDVGQVLGGSAQPMAMPAMTCQLRGASGAVLGAGGRVLGGRPPLHCPGLPVGGAAGPALPLLAISRVVRQMERGKGQGARVHLAAQARTRAGPCPVLEGATWWPRRRLQGGASGGEGLAGHLPTCTKALESSQALLSSGEGPWRGREEKLKWATWDSVVWLCLTSLSVPLSSTCPPSLPHLSVFLWSMLPCLAPSLFAISAFAEPFKGRFIQKAVREEEQERGVGGNGGGGGKDREKERERI